LAVYESCNSVCIYTLFARVAQNELNVLQVRKVPV